jgi:hypothetical protein
MAISGYATYGAVNTPSAGRGASTGSDRLVVEQAPWEPRPYCVAVPKMFEFVRSEFGPA